MAEGRCAAEPWADFGSLVQGGTPLVRRGAGTDVFICTGGEEVCVFSAQEKRVRAVLQLPAPVRDLVVSRDRQLLFVACRSGIYRINLQLLSHSQSSDAGSGPAELNISSDSLAAAADGVSSLLLVGSVLLSLCQTDRSWLLTLYQTPQQSQSSRCDVIGSSSLPAVSPAARGHTESRSVLLCVYSGEAARPSSPAAAASGAGRSCFHFPLQPVLFKLLFGAEAALAKSPVVLCGLPDGRLCYLPLRLPGSRLRILQSLEQPVVFIGASAVVGADAGCLIALGKQGRVMLMKAGGGGSERGRGVADFTERCVPGPVECACVDKSRVYYSTGSDLLTLGLSEGPTGREGPERDAEASGPGAACLDGAISLNVSGVVALDQPTCNDAGEVQLLSLSARGQLQRVGLPVGATERRSSRLPSSELGRSVGDLLSAIGDVCERASVLEKVIGSKNQLLKQLNQVMNVGFLLTDGAAAAEDRPIGCRASVGWSRLLRKDSLSLTCVLTNASPYVLERGWTLSITLLPLARSPDAAPGTGSVSYSFPLRRLRPGESSEATVPVAAAGDASFPVAVACSLLFSPRRFLGGEEEAAASPLPSGCFALPLNTLTVDWLHALRLLGPTPPPPSTGDPAGDLRAFLSSRRVGCGRGDGAPGPEGYSASVRVSSELLRDTPGWRGSEPDPKVSGSAPRSLCVSLLEWLLSENCGGVRAGLRGDGRDVGGSVICGRAPNEAAVTLTAKEVHLEEKSAEKEESLVSVEVRVESASAAAVCGLHHAVLRRIQTLLLKAPVKAWSSNKVQVSGLRQTLQRAEIQQGQISEALSVGMSSGQMQRILLRVYQQLRDAPLLMV